METILKKPIWLKVLSVFIIIFGLATLKEGGTALFTEAGKIKAGNYVPLVLWHNFIAGFFYLIAGIALFMQKSCTKRVSSLIAGTSILALIYLAVHIINGNAYEMRTVIAMTFRTAFWATIALITFKTKALNRINCNC